MVKASELVLGDVVRVSRYGATYRMDPPEWAVVIKSHPTDLARIAWRRPSVVGSTYIMDPDSSYLDDGDEFVLIPHDKLPDDVLVWLMQRQLQL